MASKSKKYKTSYSESLKEHFPFITKCSSHITDHQHKFHCTICKSNISLAHGGSNDILKHAEIPGHQKQAQALKGKLLFHSFILFSTLFDIKLSHNIRVFSRCLSGNTKLALPKQNEIHPSLNAEIKMALLIVHHDTFFNLSDHLTQYVKGEFKDSKAAKNFSCGRTKTAAIINCIGDDIKQELVKDMSQSPLSIMVDGSNDAGLEKMFPICVRIFDVNFNRIMTKFFDMNMLEGTDASAAEHMFTSIENQLLKNELS